VEMTKSILDEKRLDWAKKTIAAYGDQIPLTAQESILKQKIVIGMSPYEARLAGGAYSFKVQADPAVWPTDADPNLVIEKQAVHPDNSKIWLTFETATQFPVDGLARFTVYFEKGRVVSIEKIDSAK